MAMTTCRPSFPPPALCLVLTLALAGLPILPARAGIWEAGGLAFSDELGRFKLISVSGSGTILDPIVLVEEMDGTGPAVLVIRPLRPAGTDKNAIGAAAFLQVAVIAVVVNSGPWPWAGFDLELREALNIPSTYMDGLSFDQMRAFRRPPASDSFTVLDQISEPEDRIRFHGGGVSAGSSVRFNFFITDPTAMPQFYLIQIPRVPVGRLRVPGPLEKGPPEHDAVPPWPGLA